MQAVGRIGSYISRSVYTASGPFHPFGGAVDIIVVQQPDGTYKSSPWYIRFGKFQGVLKTKEKVVTISVNGVEADFHMYLNHKGEAYFLKETVEEDEDPVCSPPPRSGEDTNKVKNRMPMKSINCTYDSDHSENKKVSVASTDSRPSQIFRLVFDRKSTKDEENESVVSRTESLEHAKIAADLLDLKWSTNLVSPRCKKDKSSNNYNDSRFSASDISIDEVVQNLPVFCSSDQKGSSVEENGDDIKCLTEKFIPKSEFHVSSASVISEVAKSDSQIEDSVEKLNRDQFTLIHEKRVSISGGESKYNASESIVGEYSQLVSIHQSNKENVSGEVEINKHEFSEGTIFYNKKSRTLEEEQLLIGNLDDFGLAGAKQLEFSREEKEADSLFLSRDGDGVNEFSDEKCCSGFSLDQSVLNDYIYDVVPQTRRLRSISSEVCIKKTDHVQSEDVIRVVRSLPIAGPLGNKLEASENHQSRGARTFEDDKILQESKEGNANPSVGTPLRPVDSLNGNQRSWPFPFKRSKSMKVSHIDACSIENPNTTEVLTNSSDLEWTKDVTEVKKNKKTFLRTLTPTSEQLTSLNLKEGKNIVVFTFQTAMLGKQQVDARIFIWRWDTRIVISDVDGTITRSDLLGQVMPLVGMDWSQTGVAHLFSAIKENGYQLLFLSARAIAQSFLTRQLLFNIKQDGKALPDGPVVISPDGLFPSLFREVVRRAPHEFKIACLEDIKALFPADTNPFYAGFGNRHTDEFSYLKVGIPRGKIFIVNPKGEIVVNRHVETKSYLSLHGLVHGMFPPTTMSSSEQEDFNSWNFWKLTPATIDL